MALVGPATAQGGNWWESGALHGELMYCSTDVLGVASMDCAPPHRLPASPEQARADAEAIGKSPMVCTTGLAGQAALCNNAPGTD
ncbi:hypothetical protein AB0L75_40505 [Streptomyces sp. NPDC052101]|uniref:hypothetical protein n=1 Tax=Streptomyces sp. NPDC052101 TaxID=3155763 RepID=UPI00341C04C9